MRVTVFGAPLRLPVGALCGSIVVASCSSEATAPSLPSPPEGVTVSITAARQVQVTWSARPGRENVVSYSVYRDALRIGETADLFLIDSTAPPREMHEYSVASQSAGGTVSERSAVVTIIAPDATPPRVLSASPANGAVNVAPNAVIQVRFNEAMDSASFTPQNVVVSDAGSNTVFTGTLSFNRSTRTLSWTALPALPAERRVNVTVTTGVRDESGLPLASAHSFSFTVRETTPPQVVGFTPADGAIIPVGTFPLIQFSERMGDLSGIQWVNTQGTILASGGILDSLQTTVRLVPTKRVQSFVPYTVSVDGRTTDVAGNSVASGVTFTFQYGEWTLPAIASVFPADGATGVSTAVGPFVDLSAPTQLYNDYEIRFNMRETGSATTLPGFFIVGNLATHIPLSAGTLKPNTNYTVVFYHFFTDSQGVRHEAQQVWSFTTGT
jgi:hypothetical protein